MRVPSSTPAGMLTASVFSRCCTPLPPQARHGFLITRPVPWQVGQVRSTVKKPCWLRTRPAPRQVGQATGSLPASLPEPLQASQATAVGTRICACLPAKASSSVIVRL